MNTLTIEKAIRQYAEMQPKERAAILKECKALAYGNYPQRTRELNLALLKAFAEIDRRAEQAQRPQMPTNDETNAAILWGLGLLAKIGGGVVVIGGGLWFIGALVVGTGRAFIAGAIANSGTIFWGIVGLVAVVVAVAGYRNLRDVAEEETDGGEAPVQNQTIINVYSATGGDVQVNQK